VDIAILQDLLLFGVKFNTNEPCRDRTVEDEANFAATINSIIVLQRTMPLTWQ